MENRFICPREYYSCPSIDLFKCGFAREPMLGHFIMYVCSSLTSIIMEISFGETTDLAEIWKANSAGEARET